MGIGCRNVAFIAICVLLAFDVVSMTAVPRSRELDEAEALRRDQALPIHRQRRSFEDEPTPKFESNGYLEKIELTSSPGRNVDTIKVRQWNKYQINFEDNLKDKFWEITSPPNTRVQVTWERYNNPEPIYDVISGYSGKISPLLEDQKSTLSKAKSSQPWAGQDQRDALLDNVSKLPFIFSSQPVVESILSDDSKNLEGQTFTADGNSMTLHFRHPKDDGPHNGEWKAKVSYKVTSKNSEHYSKVETGNSKRTLRDYEPDEINYVRSEAKSLYLCSPETAEDPFVHANEGIITSHQGFGDNPKMPSDKYKAKNCYVTIESENGQNIQLKFNGLQVTGPGPSINENCDSALAHIKVVDQTSDSEEPHLMCTIDGKKTFEFGSKIKIDFFTGSWGDQGFSFEYSALPAIVSTIVPMEKLLEDQNEEEDQHVKDVQATEATPKTETGDDDYQVDESQSLKLPETDEYEYLGDNYEIEEESHEEKTTLPQSGKKSTNNPEQRKFSQVLAKVTMIAVGLILVVILVSAGFIACHKTKEQDAYINQLLNQIHNYENSKGGLGKGGLGVVGGSLETTPIISADQSNSNNSSSSLPSGKFPLSMTQQARHGFPSSAYAAVKTSDSIEGLDEKAGMLEEVVVRPSCGPQIVVQSSEPSSSDEIMPAGEMGLPVRMENSCYKSDSSA